MRIFFTIVSIIFLTLSINSQTLYSEIMGKWEVIDIEISGMKTENHESINMMKNTFINSIFHFKGNGIFNVTFNNDLQGPFKELEFLDNNNWRVGNDNLIKIGTESDNYSIMHINIVKENKNIYFFLPMMKMKMKKLTSETEKKITEIIKEEKKIENKDVSKKEKGLTNKEVKENEIYQFDTVENIPITNNCNPKLKKEKLKKCVTKSLNMHVARKFNADLAQNLGLKVGKYRIESKFIIDTNGNIINIEVQNENEVLKNEMIRVLNLIPKMKPASQNGKKINVEYKLPLIFEVAG